MSSRPPSAWQRIALALLFASATVLSLTIPPTIPAVGEEIAAHQSHLDSMPCHGEQPSPSSKVDVAAHLSCLACVIHCMGTTTLDGAVGLPHLRPWLGDGQPDQVGPGIVPAGLERPPDLCA